MHLRVCMFNVSLITEARPAYEQPIKLHSENLPALAQRADQYFNVCTT